MAAYLEEMAKAKRGLVPTARRLITSKNTALSTVRLQSGSFTRPGGFSLVKTNARERRLTVTFPSADVPVSVFHGLGFPPSGYTVLGSGIGSGTTFIAGGKVYNDFPLPSTSRVIVIKADTAGTVADILVR